MKEIVLNNEKLNDEDIQIFDNKVKVIIKDSDNKILICKRNGVMHFVGGKVEKGETEEQAALREIKEETGIDINKEGDNPVEPFFKMKKYEKNYYNSGKNCLLSITYLECKTNEKFDYSKRNLDELESKENFTLEYINEEKFLNELEKNRDIAKKDNREFIIDEMKYIFSEYVSEKNNKEDRDR